MCVAFKASGHRPSVALILGIYWSRERASTDRWYGFLSSCTFKLSHDQWAIHQSMLRAADTEQIWEFKWPGVTWDFMDPGISIDLCGNRWRTWCCRRSSIRSGPHAFGRLGDTRGRAFSCSGWLWWCWPLWWWPSFVPTGYRGTDWIMDFCRATNWVGRFLLPSFSCLICWLSCRLVMNHDQPSSTGTIPKIAFSGLGLSAFHKLLQRQIARIKSRQYENEYPCAQIRHQRVVRSAHLRWVRICSFPRIGGQCRCRSRQVSSTAVYLSDIATDNRKRFENTASHRNSITGL